MNKQLLLKKLRKRDQKKDYGTYSICPPKITDQIREFAQRLGAAEPQFVPNQPLQIIAPNHNGGLMRCYGQVDLASQLGMGGPVVGYSIWLIPNLLLSAEHHAVLRTASGLRDITPQPEGEPNIVFGATDQPLTIETIRQHYILASATRDFFYPLVDMEEVREAIEWIVTAGDCQISGDAEGVRTGHAKAISLFREAQRILRFGDN